MRLTESRNFVTMKGMKRVILVAVLTAVWLGCVSEVCAAPPLTRIMRKNNKLEGHRDGVNREQEPTYRTPKYYPDSYPEYGRQRSSPDAGWQNVPDNRNSANKTRSYGVGGPRASRRRF